jgi:hypothetical protein
MVMPWLYTGHRYIVNYFSSATGFPVSTKQDARLAGRLLPRSGLLDVTDDRPDDCTRRLEAGVIRAEGVDHVLKRVGVVDERKVISGVLRALILQGDVLHVGRGVQEGRSPWWTAVIPFCGASSSKARHYAQLSVAAPR